MLNLYDVAELKKLLSAADGSEIHLHDTCGGQYFSLEKFNQSTQEVIEQFVSAKGLAVTFSPDKSGFTVTKK